MYALQRNNAIRLEEYEDQGARNVDQQEKRWNDRQEEITSQNVKFHLMKLRSRQRSYIESDTLPILFISTWDCFSALQDSFLDRC